MINHEEDIVSLQEKIAVLEQRNAHLQQLIFELYYASFDSLFRSLPDAHFIFEKDKFIKYNPGFLAMIGYPSNAELSVSPADISPERQPDGRLSCEAIADVIAEALKNGWNRFEWTHCRANGEEFPVEVTLSIVERDQKEPLIYGNWREISKQKQVEREREQLQQQVIEAQRAAIRELSTPLIPIAQHVLLLPLIGSIDTQRAQQIMESLLEGIAEYQSQIAIIDITGVSVVDSQVANTLVQSANAARLIGAQVILTGIGPSMAQTLVGLDTDLSHIKTLGSLQAGIAYALNKQ